MPTRRSLAGPAITRDVAPSARSLAWIALAAGLSAATAGIVAYVPAALVLPALSVLMVAAGFAIAAGGCVAGWRTGHGGLQAWDIAGALVFLGFAAAMLANDGDALSLLAQIETHGLAAYLR